MIALFYIKILLFLFLRMALFTGGGCLFGFVLFIKFLMAALTVIVNGLGMISQAFFLFKLGGTFTFGPFTRFLMAFYAVLNVVAFF